MPPPMKASRQGRPALSSASMAWRRRRHSGIRLTSGTGPSGFTSEGAPNQPKASRRSTSPVRPGPSRRITATSSSPRSKAVSSAAEGSIRSPITREGSWRASRASRAGASAPTACSLMPMLMRSWTCWNEVRALSCAAISSRAAGRKRSPSAVNRTSRGCRCSSNWPSASSSFLMRVEISDCAVPSASAARVKLLNSAARRKAATPSRSSVLLILDRNLRSLI